MHGPLARKEDGSPIYDYAPNPGPMRNEEEDLKEHGFYVKLSESIDFDREVVDGKDDFSPRP